MSTLNILVLLLLLRWFLQFEIGIHSYCRISHTPSSDRTLRQEKREHVVKMGNVMEMTLGGFM